MCFTINIHTARDAIEQRFKVDVSRLNDFEYRYFYRAFDQPQIPVITQNEPQIVQLFSWGLIPFWVKDEQQAEKLRNSTFNARGETMDEKPSFRQSFKHHRCKVIAAGFFEWEHRNGKKIPWYISLKNDELMCMAGLYSTWTNPRTGEILNTVSIVTTRANPLMEKIHNTKKRMPIILSANNEHLWFSGELKDTRTKKFLVPIDQHLLTAHTVNSQISNQSANPFDPMTIQPFHYASDQQLF